MIPCHSAALRCTWPFAVTCMTPSSIENEIAHLTVAAFSSHLSRLRREERLVMTAYRDPPMGETSSAAVAQQSGGELPPTYPPARAAYATVQVSGPRPTLPRHLWSHRTAVSPPP